MDIVRIFELFSRIPFSSRIAGRVVSLVAPYFSTIRPRITRLGPGCCTIEMSDRRAVRNHLGSIHAIALCNLCELTMGLAVISALPEQLRWIARGMEVEYLKKARGRMTATARIDPEDLAPGDVGIPVEVTDFAGDRVARATIIVNISERPDG